MSSTPWAFAADPSGFASTGAASLRAGWVGVLSQAIQIHELNVARAKEGVYDESVRKSYKALAELKPGRYGKTELVQDVVTVPN